MSFGELRAFRLPRVLALLLCSGMLLSAAPSEAEMPPSPRGQAHFKIDRLSLPAKRPNLGLREAELLAFLSKELKREARHLDWGAGRSNQIELRFSITELELEQSATVLRLSCKAVGELPGGRKAHGNLSFSGSPNKRAELTRQVLSIVVRGVTARLAEMERKRRGTAD